MIAIIIYNCTCSLISRKRANKFKGSPMGYSSTPNQQCMKSKMGSFMVGVPKKKI